MNFTLTDDQKQIRDAIREFTNDVIAPVALEYDESQEFPREIFTQLGEMGYLGVLIPEEYGGVGLGYMEYAIIVEEVAKGCPSIALGVAAHNGLGSGHILHYGSEEIKQKYLPNLASGKVLAAWGLTEPGSGSDSGGMHTTAVRDGDDYIINGSKNFITHGNVGDTTVVLAVTDREKKTKGISAFAIDKSMAGFAPSKKENKLGMRSSDTASLTFDNVRVPASHMLGNENEGFMQAMQILEGGRVSIAALSVGLAQAALDHSIKYSKERRQFGKSLSEFQGINHKLAWMSARVEAARALTYKAAWKRDNGLEMNIDASHAKLFASELAVNAAEEAIQIHGGYGYTKDYPVEKLWRDSKLLTIGEGTSEVQRMVIARNLMG